MTFEANWNKRNMFGKKLSLICYAQSTYEFL